MFKLFAALAATALVASAGFTADPPKASASDFEKNLKIAMGVEPTGQLMRSRVETKPSGTVVMGFYLYDRNNRLLFEREVEMKSGAIVKDTSKTMSAVAKDMANLIAKQTDAKAKLPDGRLLEIAGQHMKDKTFNEMKYEKIGETLVFTVGDVSFDAATGQVVEKK